MPIFSAVPLTCLIAVSTSYAFKSGNLISAISRTWSSVNLPTGSFFPFVDPLEILAYFLIKNAVGGVLIIKSNVLS